MNVNKKLIRIQEQCLKEEDRSQEIKEDLGAALFYNQLIGKNVQAIFNKILWTGSQIRSPVFNFVIETEF